MRTRFKKPQSVSYVTDASIIDNDLRILFGSERVIISYRRWYGWVSRVKSMNREDKLIYDAILKRCFDEE